LSSTWMRTLLGWARSARVKRSPGTVWIKVAVTVLWR
jgi:hypothetical protein